MANARFVQLTDRARRVAILGNPALAPNSSIVFTGGPAVPANRVLNSSGDSIRNASGGYVLRSVN